MSNLTTLFVLTSVRTKNTTTESFYTTFSKFSFPVMGEKPIYCFTPIQLEAGREVSVPKDSLIPEETTWTSPETGEVKTNPEGRFRVK